MGTCWVNDATKKERKKIQRPLSPTTFSNPSSRRDSVSSPCQVLTKSFCLLLRVGVPVGQSRQLESEK